jgi:hypothetical protein
MIGLDPKLFKNPLHDGKKLYKLYHTLYTGGIQQMGPIEIWATSKEEAISIADERYHLRSSLYHYMYELKHRDFDGIKRILAMNEEDAKKKFIIEHKRETQQRLSLDGFIEVKEVE